MIPQVYGVTDWYCPNCKKTDQTREAKPHSRFHTCPSLRGGLTAPMLQAGVRAKVVAMDRDDYVGNEIVQSDGNGRPVMSVVTVRDNGQDVAVFAGVATANSQAYGFTKPPPRSQEAIAAAQRAKAEARAEAAQRAVARAAGHVANAATDITRQKERVALAGAQLELLAAQAALRAI